MFGPESELPTLPNPTALAIVIVDTEMMNSESQLFEFREECANSIEY